MITASQGHTIIYYQNGIDLHTYTQCLPPPSAFIHEDLWRSLIGLDRVDL